MRTAQTASPARPLDVKLPGSRAIQHGVVPGPAHRHAREAAASRHEIDNRQPGNALADVVVRFSSKFQKSDAIRRNAPN